MIARLAVTKMHGARNDFIVLDTRGSDKLNDEVAVLARRLCDRHAGIGADGILIVGESTRAHASMRVINADGSEAEMCGNGIRCVARYLDERGEGGDLRIETIAGIMETMVVERGETYQVRVDMGVPKILDVDLGVDRAVVVDTGNPHVVLFAQNIEGIDLALLGERIQHDEHFPAGTNLHLADVRNEHEMNVRHYERGAGLTMACGTGAVACVAAGISRGLVASPVAVHVPGGTLQIEIDNDGHAFMTGPAARVFDATVDVRPLEHA